MHIYTLFITALELSQQECSVQTSLISVEKETIIVSNMAKQYQNCIKLNQPFTISAKTGQVLNVTLIDFSNEQTQITYGVIKDQKIGKEISIIGNVRMRHLMSTKGHEMDVTIYTSSTNFAIDIQGRNSKNINEWYCCPTGHSSHKTNYANFLLFCFAIIICLYESYN